MDAPKLAYLPIETIRAQCVALFEYYLEKKILPGQPEAAIIAAMAEREAIIRAMVDNVVAQFLIPFATGSMLDQLSFGLGVIRNSSQAATVTLKFTLQAGHGILPILAGLRVASSDNRVTFATDADTIVNSSTNEVLITATALIDGEIGNNYQIGTITNIVDASPYLISVSNVDVSGGGASQETDDQLRARAILALSKASNAGSRSNYKGLALGASPLIIDSAVTSPISGQVNVYPLVANSPVTPQAVLDAVFSALSAETVRPLTDTVVVLSPVVKNYQLTVDVVLKYGSPYQSTIDAMNAGLQAYCKNQSRTLGADITESQLMAAGMSSYIHSISFLNFVDIAVSQIQYAFCEAITISNVTWEVL